MTTKFEPPEGFYSRNPQPHLKKGKAAPSYMIAVVVMVLFSAIIWVAYPEEAERTQITSLPVITADASSYKQEPTDPGGIEIPYQESEMFSVLEPAAGDEDADAETETVVERLLPEPEQPVDREAAITATAETEKPKAQIIAIPQPEAVKNETPAEAAPAKAAKAEPKAEEVAKVEPAAAPEAKPAPAAQTSGAYMVQLGSVKSRAGADQEWARLQKRFPSLKGLDLSVQEANLGEKGTFYRVRAAGLSKTSAESLCGEIKAKNGGGCLVVKP